MVVPDGEPNNPQQPVRNDNNALFLRAARAGHLDKVLEHLRTGTDINTSNSNGLNALHLASKEGHEAVVRELLRRGATVDAATRKGNTALHIASLAGQDAIVAILCENHANPNAQSLNGFTPLYMAAQENHENVVAFLLHNGANQELATEDGFTPLAVALQQGHDKIVAGLLENDNTSKVRLPALHIAAKKDDIKAASLLLQNEQNPDVTSKSGFTPLHIAAHYGNENVARLLLEKGAKVNYQARHNISPLHVAAKWGRTNLCTLLLAQGAIIDCRTRDLLTPLHCAARSGHEQVVDLLLEKGAPIAAKTKNGLAPLHMAAQGDHVECARILLFHKAHVDDVTVDYLTPLHVAAHCGHVRVAKLLLDRSSDPNARALNGFTPLHIACKKNRIKVVELLLKYQAAIEATTESGLSPLHVASFMGCTNIVIYLIQQGANVDVETVRGETPLHLAARANQTDIVRVLVRNGAKVDARARELQTPLHIAARLGNTDICMLLLQAGADANAATKDLYTPLHIAAKEGQEDVAVILLDHKADKKLLTKKGFTPLHLACKYGNYEVAKLLLEQGTAVDIQGKNQVTPLHVATHYNNDRVAQLLLENKASAQATAKNGYTPLHIAAKKNQMEIASVLMQYKADPNAESRAGFTPLHLAAEEGHREMSALLIENGSHVNGQAKNGLTPMHLCAQEDRVEVAAELLKHGSDINAHTKAGYTPLHVACHFGQMNMIKFLLENGADIHAVTNAQYTPLHQAAQQGHNNVVRYLLDHGASPNTKTATGQTPLAIAQRLGYVSVVETLKTVTETTIITETTTVTEERYKPHNPEAMNETMFSDSEEEPDDHQAHQTEHEKDFNESMTQGLRDSAVIHLIHTGESLTSKPYDNNDVDLDAVIKRAQNAPITSAVPDSAFLDNVHDDNVMISRDEVRPSFLISFMVDARGGAMRGCRHSGVRVIIPPRKAAAPMRITCRYLRKEKLAHPPPLSEGEALASRVLEMGPHNAKFLGPVILEVPHFASLRGREREIVILRSDDGQHWKEHQLEATEDAVQEVLNESFDTTELQQLDDLHTSRITRILTNDFPMYFAVVTRVRQEVHCVGPEGGVILSSVVPKVQAIFPDGSLTKTIKVSLQAQPVAQEIVSKLHGNRVAVSPIVTVEPRRRKFHKPITLCIPLPQSAQRGMITQFTNQPGQEPPTLRLLCSITGGSSPAQWEDITGTTQLTFTGEEVSFTTTVSARFWLMDTQTPRNAAAMAQEVYNEAIAVPYMAKFAVFARRPFPIEGQLRLFCMTDDKEDKTLEKQESFQEIAKSREVEVLSGRHQFLEFAGNLVPITKSGDQLSIYFLPFQENRLAFNVKTRQSDDDEAASTGRIAIMKEARVKAENIPPQHPICTLAITLPDYTGPLPTVSSSPQQKPITEKYSQAFSQIHDDITDPIPLAFVARHIGPDWPRLARALNIPDSDVRQIKRELSGGSEAPTILKIWIFLKGTEATQPELNNALRRIGRDDIVMRLNKNDLDSEADSLRYTDNSNLRGSNYSSKLSVDRDYDRPQTSEIKTVTTTSRYVHESEQGPIVDEKVVTRVFNGDAEVDHKIDEKRNAPLNEDEHEQWHDDSRPVDDDLITHSRQAMFSTKEERKDDNVVRTTTFTTTHVVPEPEVSESVHDEEMASTPSPVRQERAVSEHEFEQQEYEPEPEHEDEYEHEQHVHEHKQADPVHEIHQEVTDQYHTEGGESERAATPRSQGSPDNADDSSTSAPLPAGLHVPDVEVHPDSAVQKKETYEEGYATNDGGEVVAKKMTRVVTTSQSAVSGASPQDEPSGNQSDETDVKDYKLPRGSVKNQISMFESIQHSTQQPATAAGQTENIKVLAPSTSTEEQSHPEQQYIPAEEPSPIHEKLVLESGLGYDHEHKTGSYEDRPMHKDFIEQEQEQRQSPVSEQSTHQEPEPIQEQIIHDEYTSTHHEQHQAGLESPQKYAEMPESPEIQDREQTTSDFEQVSRTTREIHEEPQPIQEQIIHDEYTSPHHEPLEHQPSVEDADEEQSHQKQIIPGQHETDTESRFYQEQEEESPMSEKVSKTPQELFETEPIQEQMIHDEYTTTHQRQIGTDFESPKSHKREVESPVSERESWTAEAIHDEPIQEQIVHDEYTSTHQGQYKTDPDSPKSQKWEQESPISEEPGSFKDTREKEYFEEQATHEHPGLESASPQSHEQEPESPISRTTRDIHEEPQLIHEEIVHDEFSDSHHGQQDTDSKIPQALESPTSDRVSTKSGEISERTHDPNAEEDKKQGESIAKRAAMIAAAAGAGLVAPLVSVFESREDSTKDMAADRQSQASLDDDKESVVEHYQFQKDTEHYQAESPSITRSHEQRFDDLEYQPMENVSDHDSPDASEEHNVQQSPVHQHEHFPEHFESRDSPLPHEQVRVHTSDRKSVSDTTHEHVPEHFASKDFIGEEGVQVSDGESVSERTHEQEAVHRVESRDSVEGSVHEHPAESPVIGERISTSEFVSEPDEEPGHDRAGHDETREYSAFEESPLALQREQEFFPKEEDKPEQVESQNVPESPVQKHAPTSEHGSASERELELESNKPPHSPESEHDQSLNRDFTSERHEEIESRTALDEHEGLKLAQTPESTEEELVPKHEDEYSHFHDQQNDEHEFPEPAQKHRETVDEHELGHEIFPAGQISSHDQEQDTPLHGDYEDLHEKSSHQGYNASSELKATHEFEHTQSQMIPQEREEPQILQVEEYSSEPSTPSNLLEGAENSSFDTKVPATTGHEQEIHVHHDVVEEPVDLTGPMADEGDFETNEGESPLNRDKRDLETADDESRQRQLHHMDTHESMTDQQKLALGLLPTLIPNLGRSESKQEQQVDPFEHDAGEQFPEHEWQSQHVENESEMHQKQFEDVTKHQESDEEHEYIHRKASSHDSDDVLAEERIVHDYPVGTDEYRDDQEDVQQNILESPASSTKQTSDFENEPMAPKQNSFTGIQRGEYEGQLEPKQDTIPVTAGSEFPIAEDDLSGNPFIAEHDQSHIAEAHPEMEQLQENLSEHDEQPEHDTQRDHEAEPEQHIPKFKQFEHRLPQTTDVDQYIAEHENIESPIQYEEHESDGRALFPEDAYEQERIDYPIEEQEEETHFEQVHSGTVPKITESEHQEQLEADNEHRQTSLLDSPALDNEFQTPQGTHHDEQDHEGHQDVMTESQYSRQYKAEHPSEQSEQEQQGQKFVPTIDVREQEIVSYSPESEHSQFRETIQSSEDTDDRITVVERELSRNSDDQLESPDSAGKREENQIDSDSRRTPEYNPERRFEEYEHGSTTGQHDIQNRLERTITPEEQVPEKTIQTDDRTTPVDETEQVGESHAMRGHYESEYLPHEHISEADNANDAFEKEPFDTDVAPASEDSKKHESDFDSEKQSLQSVPLYEEIVSESTTQEPGSGSEQFVHDLDQDIVEDRQTPELQNQFEDKDDQISHSFAEERREVRVTPDIQIQDYTSTDQFERESEEYGRESPQLDSHQHEHEQDARDKRHVEQVQEPRESDLEHEETQKEQVEPHGFEEEHAGRQPELEHEYPVESEESRQTISPVEKQIVELPTPSDTNEEYEQAVAHEEREEVQQQNFPQDSETEQNRSIHEQHREEASAEVYPAAVHDVSPVEEQIVAHPTPELTNEEYDYSRQEHGMDVDEFPSGGDLIQRESGQQELERDRYQAGHGIGRETIHETPETGDAQFDEQDEGDQNSETQEVTKSSERSSIKDEYDEQQKHKELENTGYEFVPDDQEHFVQHSESDSQHSADYPKLFVSGSQESPDAETVPSGQQASQGQAEDYQGLEDVKPPTTLHDSDDWTAVEEHQDVELEQEENDPKTSFSNIEKERETRSIPENLDETQMYSFDFVQTEDVEQQKPHQVDDFETDRPTVSEGSLAGSKASIDREEQDVAESAVEEYPPHDHTVEIASQSSVDRVTRESDQPKQQFDHPVLEEHHEEHDFSPEADNAQLYESDDKASSFEIVEADDVPEAYKHDQNSPASESGKAESIRSHPKSPDHGPDDVAEQDEQRQLSNESPITERELVSSEHVPEHQEHDEISGHQRHPDESPDVYASGHDEHAYSTSEQEFVTDSHHVPESKFEDSEDSSAAHAYQRQMSDKNVQSPGDKLDTLHEHDEQSSQKSFDEPSFSPSEQQRREFVETTEFKEESHQFPHGNEEDQSDSHANEQTGESQVWEHTFIPTPETEPEHEQHSHGHESPEHVQKHSETVDEHELEHQPVVEEHETNVFPAGQITSHDEQRGAVHENKQFGSDDQFDIVQRPTSAENQPGADFEFVSTEEVHEETHSPQVHSPVQQMSEEAGTPSDIDTRNVEETDTYTSPQLDEKQDSNRSDDRELVQTDSVHDDYEETHIHSPKEASSEHDVHEHVDSPDAGKHSSEKQMYFEDVEHQQPESWITGEQQSDSHRSSGKISESEEYNASGSPEAHGQQHDDFVTEHQSVLSDPQTYQEDDTKKHGSDFDSEKQSLQSVPLYEEIVSESKTQVPGRGSEQFVHDLDQDIVEDRQTPELQNQFEDKDDQISHSFAEERREVRVTPDIQIQDYTSTDQFERESEEYGRESPQLDSHQHEHEQDARDKRHVEQVQEPRESDLEHEETQKEQVEPHGFEEEHAGRQPELEHEYPVESEESRQTISPVEKQIVELPTPSDTNEEYEQAVAHEEREEVNQTTQDDDFFGLDAVAEPEDMLGDFDDKTSSFEFVQTEDVQEKIADQPQLSPETERHDADVVEEHTHGGHERQLSHGEEVDSESVYEHERSLEEPSKLGQETEIYSQHVDNSPDAEHHQKDLIHSHEFDVESSGHPEDQERHVYPDEMAMQHEKAVHSEREDDRTKSEPQKHQHFEHMAEPHYAAEYLGTPEEETGGPKIEGFEFVRTEDAVDEKERPSSDSPEDERSQTSGRSADTDDRITVIEQIQNNKPIDKDPVSGEFHEQAIPATPTFEHLEGEKNVISHSPQEEEPEHAPLSRDVEFVHEPLEHDHRQDFTQDVMTKSVYSPDDEGEGSKVSGFEFVQPFDYQDQQELERQSAELDTRDYLNSPDSLDDKPDELPTVESSGDAQVIEQHAEMLVQDVFDNLELEQSFTDSLNENADDHKDVSMHSLSEPEHSPAAPLPSPKSLTVERDVRMLRPSSPVPPTIAQDESSGEHDSNDSKGSVVDVSDKRYRMSCDNISESSLQEFERLEQEMREQIGGSPLAEEIEKIASQAGSVSSLTEFENIEKEIKEALEKSSAEAEEVMMLSDIREESEAEDMSVREDDEEDDSLSDNKPPQSGQKEERKSHHVPETMFTSADSLEAVARQQYHPDQLETSTDSLEIERQLYSPNQNDHGMSTSMSTTHSQMDADSLLEGVGQSNPSQDTNTTFEDYQEDDDNDSLTETMEGYPTTITTFQTTQLMDDGSQETIQRRVLTRVTDPVHNKVRFTGTEDEQQLQRLRVDNVIESVDEEGNITTTSRIH